VAILFSDQRPNLPIRSKVAQLELQINPRTKDQILILDCTGRMVSGESLHSVREAVKQLVSKTNAVVVNLDAVSYIDSEGLSVLVSIHSSVRNRGGKVRLAGANPVIKDLFQLAKLLDVMELYETVDQAVKAFRKIA
jgi:anti-sigma B factor antagonist